MRSASLAPIDCLKSIVTASLETGARVRLDRRRAASAAGATCSGCGSENVPLTRWPGCVRARSRPTRRVTGGGDHVGRGGRGVVRATPGVNAPKLAGGRASATASPAPCRRPASFGKQYRRCGGLDHRQHRLGSRGSARSARDSGCRSGTNTPPAAARPGCRGRRGASRPSRSCELRPTRGAVYSVCG